MKYNSRKFKSTKTQNNSLVKIDRKKPLLFTSPNTNKKYFKINYNTYTLYDYINNSKNNLKTI